MFQIVENLGFSLRRHADIVLKVGNIIMLENEIEIIEQIDEIIKSNDLLVVEPVSNIQSRVLCNGNGEIPPFAFGNSPLLFAKLMVHQSPKTKGVFV